MVVFDGPPKMLVWASLGSLVLAAGLVVAGCTPESPNTLCEREEGKRRGLAFRDRHDSTRRPGWPSVGLGQMGVPLWVQDWGFSVFLVNGGLNKNNLSGEAEEGDLAKHCHTTVTLIWAKHGLPQMKWLKFVITGESTRGSRRN